MNQHYDALMSYTRFDDQNDGAFLTAFRERLSHEVRAQSGQEFRIFQDTKDIKWGEQFQERIDSTLDTITFFIPILTPSFFASEFCRYELETFLAREQELGRSDLVLPVYYIEVAALENVDLRVNDPLMQTLAARQRIDWRELRFEPFDAPQIRRTLAQMAQQIAQHVMMLQERERKRDATEEQERQRQQREAEERRQRENENQQQDQERQRQRHKSHDYAQMNRARPDTTSASQKQNRLPTAQGNNDQEDTIHSRKHQGIFYVVFVALLIGVVGMVYILISNTIAKSPEINVVVRVTDPQSRSVSGAKVTLFYGGETPPTGITASGIIKFTIEASSQEGQLVAEMEGYEVAQEIIDLQESTHVQIMLTPLDADHRSVLVRAIYAESSQPVANAEVILIIQGDTHVGTTDDNGLVRFDIPFTDATMDATITVDAEDSHISNQVITIHPDQLQEVQVTTGGVSDQ
jgi:flagellar biosynthesis GTPase FlhF